MSKVINLSMADVVSGNYPAWAYSETTVLIQIQDCTFFHRNNFCIPKDFDIFMKVYKFRFDDLEDVNSANCMTDLQAEKIAKIINYCYDNNINIIVHCHAGICRSGAVTEACVMKGFEDDEQRYRQPNLLVKKKLTKQLGLDHKYEDS